MTLVTEGPAWFVGPDALDRLSSTRSIAAARPDAARILGSQLLLQSVWIAGIELPDLTVSSVHAHFLAAGRPALPVEFERRVLRRGRTVTVVSVEIHQGDRAVGQVTVSLIGPRAVDLDWQVPAPDAPAPGELDATPLVGGTPGFSAFEVAAARRQHPERSDIHPYWIRHRSALPDDRLLHSCLLVWLTDIGVSASAFPSHVPFPEKRLGTSLDHAVWFHRPVRADRWMLISAESASVFGGRGMALGSIHDARGTRLLTIAQESFKLSNGDDGSNEGQRNEAAAD